MLSAQGRQPGKVCKRCRLRLSCRRSEWPVGESFHAFAAGATYSLDCSSCGAEPPAVSRPEGQPALFARVSKECEGEKNQFLIKQICKCCIKRCSTFALPQLSAWCDLEDQTCRGRCLNTLVVGKGVAFSLLIDGCVFSPFTFSDGESNLVSRLACCSLNI